MSIIRQSIPAGQGITQIYLDQHNHYKREDKNNLVFMEIKLKFIETFYVLGINALHVFFLIIAKDS